jgi:hypothetical protein
MADERMIRLPCASALRDAAGELDYQANRATGWTADGRADAHAAADLLAALIPLADAFTTVTVHVRRERQ